MIDIIEKLKKVVVGRVFIVLFDFFWKKSGTSFVENTSKIEAGSKTAVALGFV